MSGSGLLGRLRGRSKAPEPGLPPPGAQQQDDENLNSSGKKSGSSAGLLSRIRGKSFIGDGEGKKSRQGSQPPSRQSSQGPSRQNSQGPSEGTTPPISPSPSPKSKAASPSSKRKDKDYDLHLKTVTLQEDAKREQLCSKAAWEYQELTTLCLSNALLLTRKETLGKGISKGDMWCLQHLAQACKQEAVEFSDSDGDAVRMLLNDKGGLNICVNGVVRGEPKQMRWDANKKLIRSKPWRIGLSDVPPEDLPVLLGHLGVLFSKAGLVHNFPTELPEDDSDPAAELKKQMAKERENTGKMMEDLDSKTDELARVAAELSTTKGNLEVSEAELKQVKAELDDHVAKSIDEKGNLQKLLGKKAEDERQQVDKVETIQKRMNAMQAALDQAVIKRREAESVLGARDEAIADLKREVEVGRTSDKNEIDNLTSELSMARDENARFKHALADYELKNAELQNSLNQSVARRQQAEGALLQKEEQTNLLLSRIGTIESSSSTDTEDLEKARRAAIEMEENAKREYFTLWFTAEARIAELRQKYYTSERKNVEQTEAKARLVLEAEERGRREYQGIWLRAELRQVANNTASSLERSAMSSLQGKLLATQGLLRRSRNAYKCAIDGGHLSQISNWATAARTYRMLQLYALWRKYDRQRDRAADIALSLTKRNAMTGAYHQWRFWVADHANDRMLAIRAYMQQHPIFYMDEAIARGKLHMSEEYERRLLLASSHLHLTEHAVRCRVAEEWSNGVRELAVWLSRGPLSATQNTVGKQLDMMTHLVKLEEGKVGEMQRVNVALARQRDQLAERCNVMMGDSFKIEILRLFYGHLDGKRQIEVEWLKGIVDMLWSRLVPSRPICDGWMLVSLADWQGGGTWNQKYVWLDKDKGQLLYSSRDPRQSGGVSVHGIRLASMVSVEVELFADGLPPPVSRYQQLGFYIELSNGKKHRFCAATVGERTEWLDNLRRAVLGAWRASDTPHTYVPTISQLSELKQPPSIPATPLTLPTSGTYRKAKNITGSPRHYPQPSPSPRHPQPSPSPRHLPASPRERKPSSGMPLEHMSYIGLP